MKQKHRLVKMLSRDTPECILAVNVYMLRAEDNGWTQSELAERSGLTRNYISQIERAAVNPTLGSLTTLAEALDVSVPSLLTKKYELVSEE